MIMVVVDFNLWFKVFWISFFECVLSVEVVLFKIKIFGLVIMLCVIVSCCFWLFEKFCDCFFMGVLYVCGNCLMNFVDCVILVVYCMWLGWVFGLICCKLFVIVLENNVDCCKI